MWISQNPYKSVHFAEPSPEKDCNLLEFASSKLPKVQCINMNECVCQSWGNLLCKSYHTGFNRIKQLVGCRML